MKRQRAGSTKKLSARSRGDGRRRSMKIGDQWNAITIIALSQSNPLKAVAEFVENSIDAGATEIQVIRGREAGESYLRIVDNGRGVPLDSEGKPDFHYVGTHICDSLKRRIKLEQNTSALQGEFGIGLLSFWTVGETLTMKCAGSDGKTYQMTMHRSKNKFEVQPTRQLVGRQGTELMIGPLLPGLRQLSGERLEAYLAAELRNRILSTGVKIRILDRLSRMDRVVEARRFEGAPLVLPTNPELSRQKISVELYLVDPQKSAGIALYRRGTRVLEQISQLEAFQRVPWSSGYFQGWVDCPDLQLSPASRLGVIHDQAFEDAISAISSLEPTLIQSLEQMKIAEEEESSKATLEAIQKAFRDAVQMLPAEDYDWFAVVSSKGELPGRSTAEGPSPQEGAQETTILSDAHAPSATSGAGSEVGEESQRAFFEFPGPLHSARVLPGSSILGVGQGREFRAVGYDRKRKHADQLEYEWSLVEGGGEFEVLSPAVVRFRAPGEPGMCRLSVVIRQGEVQVGAEAMVTVVEQVAPRGEASRSGSSRGLPGYTFERSPGQLWRSRYDEARELIVINSGHRDFIFASQTKALRLRYILRLFSKELVQKNFPGASPSELMDRLVEVSLYVEQQV